MIDRRTFTAASAAMLLSAPGRLGAQQPGSTHVTVDLPRGRVPLSFIIDDSTCLVNMGKFCMSQFAATYPERQSYQKPWKEWPDEIPDSFVREFGQWCAEQGVKGKYSVVASGDESAEPKVEALRNAESDLPEMCMNVYEGTGDWFGGWDGALQSEGHKYCSKMRQAAAWSN